jgi:hypothetical protein
VTLISKIDIWRAATPDAEPRDELAARDNYHGQVTMAPDHRGRRHTARCTELTAGIFVPQSD